MQRKEHDLTQSQHLSKISIPATIRGPCAVMIFMHSRHSIFGEKNDLFVGSSPPLSQQKTKQTIYDFMTEISALCLPSSFKTCTSYFKPWGKYMSISCLLTISSLVVSPSIHGCSLLAQTCFQEHSWDFGWLGGSNGGFFTLRIQRIHDGNVCEVFSQQKHVVECCKNKNHRE